MNLEKQVTCISAGLEAPKKADSLVARSQLYLNYGLLGLASVLHARGWHPSVIHGRYQSPHSLIDEQMVSGRLPTTTPLLLSIPSSFALSWSRKFCDEVKRRWPHQRIIVGGRWVTADDARWLRSQLPTVDLVVFGTAENTIHDLLFPSRWQMIAGTEHQKTAAPASASPRLDYRLLDRHKDFTPSFEVSRGCGRGCNFCAEADAPLSSMKPADELATEIADAVEYYGDADLRAYLEASFFCPSTQWIEQFRHALALKGLSLQWRTETRVDSISAKQIELLAKTGLKVLDLGLETASHGQITAMGKSTNPAAYLRKASSVLQACADNGIWAKVNVLLYPGETSATLDETRTWLEQHRPWIKGLSVGPTIVFRYGDRSAAYLKTLEAHGAKAVAAGDLDRLGYTHLHLSEEFSHDRAIAESLKLSKSFMTARDYFDLKSFSYLPRQMNFDQFLALARQSNEADMSCRMAQDAIAEGATDALMTPAAA